MENFKSEIKCLDVALLLGELLAVFLFLEYIASKEKEKMVTSGSLLRMLSIVTIMFYKIHLC